MSPLERDYMLRVRMTEDERRQLHALADDQGLTSSDIVRQLIRREHQAKVRQRAHEATEPQTRKRSGVKARRPATRD